jgi:prefoldin beta subunit
MDISPKLENQLSQFEQLRTQVQMIFNQKVQMSTTLKEIQGAVEELKKANKDTPIFRNVGALLVKVDDLEKLNGELKEEADTLEVRIKQLEKQEKVLNEKYMKLQESIQQAMQNPGK